MSVVFAPIAATANNRLRRHHHLSHGRRRWHHRHHPDPVSYTHLTLPTGIDELTNTRIVFQDDCRAEAL